jgi:hypothetical protein
LRDDLIAWLRRARAASLSAEDVTALIETTMRSVLIDEPDGDANPDRVDDPSTRRTL